MFARSCKIIVSRAVPIGVGAVFAFESQLQDKKYMSSSSIFIMDHNDSFMSQIQPQMACKSVFNSMFRFRTNCDAEAVKSGPVRKSMLKYPNGDVYIGEVRSGLRSGHGVMTYGTTKMVYNGEWVNGYMQGQGVMKYADGTVFYNGEWRQDGRDGFGVWTDTNGDVYTGEFKNNKRHGKGVMKYNDGRTFEGEWREGRKRGRGTMTYANGDVYTGKWKKGEKVFTFTAGKETDIEVTVNSDTGSEVSAENEGVALETL